MDKLKCPRCKNEELKGTENYCSICGLNLKGAIQEVQVQDIELMCKPIVKYLKENYSLYCNIIISYNQIKITEDILGVPVKSND